MRPTMRPAVTSVLAAWGALIAMSAAPDARADVTYVVQPGHTVEKIAHQYHVGVDAILQANHLKTGQPLEPGQKLVIPGVAAASPASPGNSHGSQASRPAHTTRGSTATAAPALSHEPRSFVHGEHDVIHAVRLGVPFRIRMKDVRGRLPAAALGSFEELMKQGEATHPPDPRLLALIGLVSNHFDGKVLEVVSGFRAYTPTQYTLHSNHNLGKALDFRVRGVPNTALRDFCLTLRNAGCGYYPNSTFVHVDTRDAKASWVDLAGPGEPPRYEKPGGAEDEGANEVPDPAMPAWP
jgi:hypothetical protein